MSVHLVDDNNAIVTEERSVAPIRNQRRFRDKLSGEDGAGILKQAFGVAVAHETDLAFAGFVDDADRIAFNGNGDVEAVRRVDGKGADGPAAFGDFGKERFKRLNDGRSARVAHDGRFVEAELLGFEKLERSAGDGEEAVAFRARALSGAPAKLGLGLLQGVHRDEGRTKLCVRRFGGHRRIRTMIVVFGPEVALHEEPGTDRFGTVAAAFRPEFVT